MHPNTTLRILKFEFHIILISFPQNHQKIIKTILSLWAVQKIGTEQIWPIGYSLLTPDQNTKIHSIELSKFVA